MATRRKPEEIPPPRKIDQEGWRGAIKASQLPSFTNEELVAAIQDLGANADKWVRNGIAAELNQRFYRILRPRVGRHHPDKGEEIIRRTIFKLFKAIALPKSKDGQALRKACFARVVFRLKDAIIEEGRERRIPEEFFAEKVAERVEYAEPVEDDDALDKISVEAIEVREQDKDNSQWEAPSLIPPSADDDEDAAPTKAYYDPSYLDETRVMQESIDVKRLLESAIPDRKKRLAFRLYMEKVPVKSKRELPRSNVADNCWSIAEAVGKDEKTVRIWIKECQDILKTKVRKP